jgi:hypothetical protein
VAPHCGKQLSPSTSLAPVPDLGVGSAVCTTKRGIANCPLPLDGGTCALASPSVTGHQPLETAGLCSGRALCRDINKKSREVAVFTTLGSVMRAASSSDPSCGPTTSVGAWCSMIRLHQMRGSNDLEYCNHLRFWPST